MRKIFAVVLILMSLIARAQETAPDFTFDDVTNKVTYTEVVNVVGVPAKDLYKRLDNWFKTFFPNPATVIQSRDTLNYLITGEHRFNTYKMDKTMGKVKDGVMQYNIEIAVKDGRYKYTITDILKFQSPKIPIEDWVTADPIPQAVVPALIQTDSFFNNEIDNLKTVMSTEPKVKKTDW